MSDSEMADVASEETIVKTLRDIVLALHKSGNTQDLTKKRVRAKTEEKLGLPDGFLKSEDWKQKSDDLIVKTFEACADADDAEPEPAPKKEAAPKKSTTVKAAPQKKSKLVKETTKGVKRKAAVPAKKTNKRRKTDSPEEELSDAPEDSQLSDAESEPPKKTIRRKKKVVAEESDEDDAPEAQKEPSDDEDEVKPSAKTKKTSPPTVKEDASDSDLSSLIDESPVKKKRGKSEEKPKKETKTKASKAKAKPKTEDDPDQAEIKRLQGWLVKCGIRKVWGKELANCSTPKEKIRHLKGMLSDAGMDGKYSVEKAARIKEKREFAKDLEDIQAGAAAWGQQELTQTGRPRRSGNRPVLKTVVPVFSDDSEDPNEQEDDDPTDDDDSPEDEEDDGNGGSGKSESEDDGDSE